MFEESLFSQSASISSLNEALSPTGSGNIQLEWEPSQTNENEEEDCEIIQITNPYSSKKVSTERGRKHDIIWQYFNAKDRSRSMQSKCRECGISVSSRAYRLKQHLKQCKKQGNRKSLAPTSTSSALESKEKHTVKEAGLKSFIKTLTSKETKEIHRGMARFIFSCNLPFRTVENPFFQQLLKQANPATTFPSRKQLGEKFLDEIFEETVGIVRNKVRGSNVTIMQDGWSTGQNEAVICHCIHSHYQNHFLNVVTPGINQKTADYCSRILSEAIMEAENVLSCKVVALVTDNCNTMLALRELIVQKYPQLITLGCQAHVLNLLGNDISNSKILDDVIYVQKFFKNHHYEGARLKQMRKNRPKIPATTRWNSSLDSIRSYIENEPTYVQIMRDSQSNAHKDKRLKSILKCMDMYDQLKQQLQFLEPVSIALDKVILNSSFSTYPKI